MRFLSYPVDAELHETQWQRQSRHVRERLAAIRAEAALHHEDSARLQDLAGRPDRADRARDRAA